MGSQKFCNICYMLVACISQTEAVQPVVGRCCGWQHVVVGGLSHYALFHPAQIKMIHCVIQKFIYKFELGHNLTEATKNLCCAID